MRRCAGILASALPLLLCMIARPAHAGDGFIRDGKLNLNVMFAYDEPQPETWKPLFDAANVLLYNATNGQLQLGTINVVNCGYSKEDMDIWILDDEEGGAFATPSALGRTGRIYLTQLHKSTTSAQFGPFGLVHELGHYVFGLYDEYKGESGAAPIAEQTDGHRQPNQFCPTEQDGIACLMDGGSTILPNNARTEFCTRALGGLSSAHNTGTDVTGQTFTNAQELLNGESCWETINRVLGYSEPAAVDPDLPAGLDPIDFVIEDLSNRVVICVDRSGSMIDAGLFAMAKAGATQLVDLLHARKTVVIGGQQVTLTGDVAGITSFANAANSPFPLREIASDADKAAAIAAIEALQSNGITNFGAALDQSLGDIEQAGQTQSCAETIILLSDGTMDPDITTDVPPSTTDPMSIVPLLQERGVRVYTVGLDPTADTHMLQEVAEQTGGRFFLVQDPSQLSSVISEVSAVARTGAILLNANATTAGENYPLPAVIDRFSEEVTAVLNWDLGPLDLTLTSPTGDVITVDDASTRPDVEAVRRGNFLYIRVISPETGQWLLVVNGSQVTGLTAFDLSVLTEEREVVVEVSTDQATYTFPDPIQLRVDVTAEIPVANAEVSAVVTRPQDDPVSVQLFDDGNPANGDAFANDGVYGARFDQFAGNGLYRFDVEVFALNGMGPDPNLPFVEDGPGPPMLPIPFFTRTVSHEVFVQDAPNIAVGDLRFDPKIIEVFSAREEGFSNVVAYLEVPGLSVVDASVVLNEGIAPVLVTPGDFDEDGISDVRLEFDYFDIVLSTSIGFGQQFRVDGSASDGKLVRPFFATDYVSLIDAVFLSQLTLATPLTDIGDDLLIDWDDVPGLVSYDIHLARDMETFAEDIGSTDVSQLSWTVTGPPTYAARFGVDAYLIPARDAERGGGFLVKQFLSDLILIRDPEADPVSLLGAVMDNTIYEGNNNSNGAGNHFFAGQNGGKAPSNVRRGLLAFDLSEIVPESATITNAELRLHMSASIAGPFDVALHRLTDSWGEGTSQGANGEGFGAPASSGDATWDYRFFDKDLWATPGGDFDPAVSASTVVDDNGYYTWSGPGLVEDIQSWLTDPSANHGWILRSGEDPEVHPTAKRFDSHTNPNNAVRPALIIQYGLTVDTEEPSAVPRFVTLSSAPNPFNPRTTIRYDVADAGAVRLTIFDLQGRLLRTLLDQPLVAGNYVSVWDGRDDAGRALPTGIYLARLTTPGGERTHKLVMVR